jgi:hypothetical protein
MLLLGLSFVAFASDTLDGVTIGTTFDECVRRSTVAGIAGSTTVTLCGDSVNQVRFYVGFMAPGPYSGMIVEGLPGTTHSDDIVRSALSARDALLTAHVQLGWTIGDAARADTGLHSVVGLSKDGLERVLAVRQATLPTGDSAAFVTLTTEGPPCTHGL